MTSCLLSHAHPAVLSPSFQGCLLMTCSGHAWSSLLCRCVMVTPVPSFLFAATKFDRVHSHLPRSCQKFLQFSILGFPFFIAAWRSQRPNAAPQMGYLDEVHVLQVGTKAVKRKST